MVEVKLRWYVEVRKRRWKTMDGMREATYFLHYILVYNRLAISLLDLVPCLDPENKVITFKPEQECDGNNLIRLRWSERREKSWREADKGRVYTMHYIFIPSDILSEFNLSDLLSYDPYLDPEKKMIVFKPKQEQGEKSVLLI